MTIAEGMLCMQDECTAILTELRRQCLLYVVHKISSVSGPEKVAFFVFSFSFILKLVHLMIDCKTWTSLVAYQYSDGFCRVFRLVPDHMRHSLFSWYYVVNTCMCLV